ncbi:MAG: hypothetical protein CFH05_00904 [Alphaproteobacteria bacterium MarineAlpha3_Bin4]|nr:MAG: hypothetical protein CFH05_00904 [Alphaproteobacteria bacterium MarineAlpha3_Bin4]
MKKLFILVGALLLVAGGTLSIMIWMNIGPFQGNTAQQEEAPPDPTLFVDMEPLLIPVFKGDKVAATLKFQVKLETIGLENVAKIQHLMPKINDLFMRELYGFMPRLLKVLKEEQKIDFLGLLNQEQQKEEQQKEGPQFHVLVINQRLKLISDKFIGPDLVTKVLVQSVINAPAG